MSNKYWVTEGDSVHFNNMSIALSAQDLIDMLSDIHPEIIAANVLTLESHLWRHNEYEDGIQFLLTSAINEGTKIWIDIDDLKKMAKGNGFPYEVEEKCYIDYVGEMYLHGDGHVEVLINEWYEKGDHFIIRYQDINNMLVSLETYLQGDLT